MTSTDPPVKHKKKKFFLIVVCLLIVIGIFAGYLSFLNIGLKGNAIPARTPMFLIKPILGEPENELHFNETGRGRYTYENVNIWGELAHVSYSGFDFLWVDEIHVYLEPTGDPTLKYNEILSALQKAYSEEPPSHNEEGLAERHMMSRNLTFFEITLSDTGRISLSLYIY